MKKGRNRGGILPYQLVTFLTYQLKEKEDRGKRKGSMSFLRKQESIFYLSSDIRLLTSVFWIPDQVRNDKLKIVAGDVNPVRCLLSNGVNRQKCSRTFRGAIPEYDKLAKTPSGSERRNNGKNFQN